MEISGIHKSNRVAGDVPWKTSYYVNGDTIVWDCWARAIDDRWTKISGGQIFYRDPSIIQEVVAQASEAAVRDAVEGRV